MTPSIEEIKSAIEEVRKVTEGQFSHDSSYMKSLNSLLSLAEYVVENGLPLEVSELRRFLSKYKSHCEHMSGKKGLFACQGCVGELTLELVTKQKEKINV